MRWIHTAEQLPANSDAINGQVIVCWQMTDGKFFSDVWRRQDIDSGSDLFWLEGVPESALGLLVNSNNLPSNPEPRAKEEPYIKGVEQC